MPPTMQKSTQGFCSGFPVELVYPHWKSGMEKVRPRCLGYLNESQDRCYFQRLLGWKGGSIANVLPLVGRSGAGWLRIQLRQKRGGGKPHGHRR